MSPTSANTAAQPRRDARRAVALATAACLAVATLMPGSGSASASIARDVSGDKSKIQRLEREIAAEGERVQSLVGRLNQAQAQVDALDAQIAKDREHVAADQRGAAAAIDAVRRIAVQVYVSGSGLQPTAAAGPGGSLDLIRVFEQRQYAAAVGDKWDEVARRARVDRERTADAQRVLQAHAAQAKRTLHDLAKARDAANAAIATQEATLRSVKGDLRALLAAAEAKRRAQEAASERALADAARQVPDVSSSPSVDVAPHPTAGSYSNPFRAVGALSPERIDQGVDYAGFGPIYAIGNGVVLKTQASGWPGGTFIAYRLSNGPAAGLVVFAAEDIAPSVSIGQTVSASTVIGHIYAGPDGIETGWADPSSLPDTMARSAGQFDGSHSSAFGVNFSQLLQSTGAPGGRLNAPVHGSLPSDWPRW